MFENESCQVHLAHCRRREKRRLREALFAEALEPGGAPLLLGCGMQHELRREDRKVAPRARDGERAREAHKVSKSPPHSPTHRGPEAADEAHEIQSRHSGLALVDGLLDVHREERRAGVHRAHV